MDGMDEYTLYGSFHTVEIHTDNASEESLKYLMTTKVVRQWYLLRDTDKYKYGIVLNLNNYYGSPIYQWSLFMRYMQDITGLLGVNKWIFWRVDFRLDNYDQDSYARYIKFNRLVVLAVARGLAIKNTYQSIDMQTLELITMSIKKESNYEFEIYNRHHKSQQNNSNDRAVTRIEMRTLSQILRQLRTPKNRRSKGIKSGEYELIKYAIQTDWKNKLLRALSDQNITATIESTADTIKDLSRQRKALYPEEPEEDRRDYIVTRYADWIFNPEELRQVLKQDPDMISYNINSMGKNIKNKYKSVADFNYIRKKDIAEFKNTVKNAIYNYFAD